MVGYCINKRCSKFNIETRMFNDHKMQDNMDTRLYCVCCDEPLSIEKVVSEVIEVAPHMFRSYNGNNINTNSN